MRAIKANQTKGPCRSWRYAKKGSMWDVDVKDQKCVTCSNRESDYYGAWLNMNIHGRFYPNVFWPGCSRYKKESAGSLRTQRNHKTIGV